MEQKLFPLGNRGMSRDTSISKEKNEFAFENHNIRILARDHDTLLSVTNERGNKEVEGVRVRGTVIGWNVLNEYIILFTVDSEADRIYRLKYTGNGTRLFDVIPIYIGNKITEPVSPLGFDVHYPIESVVDFESEDIMKIYWVDGKNVLRFLNFSDSYLEKHLVNGTTLENPEFDFSADDFDSTKSAYTNLSVKILRESGGSSRSNGVAQYFISYYNKNGQQTGIVYSSPLVYLSPEDRGGDADGTNSNKIRIEVENVDTGFEYIRLYQIFRSSKDIANVAYLISELSTASGSATFSDNGVPQETVDISSLLFLSSQEVHAGTLTTKDNTLFLGDLKSVGNDNVSELDQAIKNHAFLTESSGRNWRSAIVNFVYSDGLTEATKDIPYVIAEGYYPYENQLKYTNDRITTFKGGEKYRFALRFYRKNGTYSKSFWIGDKVNPLFPNITGSSVRRALAVCTIPQEILEAASGFSSVQLMIAEASYSDRSIMAQGIVSPTLFNLYNRYRNVPYSQSSWIFRPKGGEYPYVHYDSLANSDNRYSEIQNCYWNASGSSADNTPSPLFYINIQEEKLANPPRGFQEINGIRIEYTYERTWLDLYEADMVIKFYKDGVEIPSARKDFRRLGNKHLGELSLSTAVSEILRVYDSVDIPVSCRKSESALRNKFLELSPNMFNPRDHSYEVFPSSGTYQSIDPTIMNASMQFAVVGREYYFVDENIVTLNSPEIDYRCVNVDRNAGLKFRIVGVARFTGSINDYAMETTDFRYVGNRLLKTKFSSENISNSVEGMTAWPMYLENYFEKQTGGDEEEGSLISYMMYMWHKSGSIPEVTFEDKKVSVLKSKLFANLHFSFYSVYNSNLNNWKVTPDDLRQFDSPNSQIYMLKVGGEEKSYMANVDELSVMPDGVKYPIFYSRNFQYSDGVLSLSSDDDRDTQAPIPITYNSNPHAVIVLPNTESGNHILPYLFDKDAYTETTIDRQTTAGPYVPWKEPKDLEQLSRMYRALLPQQSVAPPVNGSYQLPIVVGEFTDGVGTATINSNNVSLLSELIEASSDYIPATDVFALFQDANSLTDVYLVNIKDSISTDLSIDFEYERLGSGIPWNIKMRFKSTGVGITSVDYDIVILDNDALTDPPVFQEADTIIVPEDSGTDYTHTIELPSEGVSSEKVFLSFVIRTSEELNPLSIPTSPDTTFVVTSSETRHSWDYNSAYSFTVKDAFAYKLSELPQGTRLEFINIYNKTVARYYSTDNTFSEISAKYGEQENHPIQNKFQIDSDVLPEGSKYMYIGELYHDYDSGSINDDLRYGGISESAVQNNTFIPAGPKVPITGTDSLTVIGNEGDTFFQRWDSVKTVPRSESDTNQVVDIASVMLETHINIDGRTDKDRGSTKLTMIDWTNFGKLNPVYSQMNDFQKGFNADESDNLDVYRSSITWTLEKHPNADVDEWTHIPLASALKLDGDKGAISALRRFENSIIAFQEKGIAEILFNSRTQIATGDGVPIEIANSGKVEGKRYITNKYGTLNKWSIVEGKSGLYFVDNLNKIIGVLSDNGVKSLSTEQKFDAWVRDNHSTESWNPDTFDNFVSYYDRVHSDVYFIKSSKHNQPCLVYSEILGSFVSFYDYSDISMLTNIQDRFISCRRDGYGNSRLWLQNEGLYGRFFGEDKDFWVTWRVAPDGYTDKIWTGLEYRSDFMKVLNNMGDSIVPEDDLIDGNGASIVADKTFDALEVWDEYQTTGEQAIPKRSLDMITDTYSDSVKRFRIWRIDIPRAIKSVTSGNRFGLDRIRNPWVYLKLKKNGGNFGQELMQLHDIVVKYFSEN